MANKLITCKTCGAEMASNAKNCPKCGAKNKKPIYKKWWFYVLVVVILIGAVEGSQGGNKDAGAGAAEIGTSTVSTAKATSVPAEYQHYNVTELLDALKANAMKAQSTYKDQYVELEGYLGTIDSDGKYIGLSAGEDNYNYLFQEIQCYIKTEEQRNAIMEKNKGDRLIIRGKIINVGEVLGYSLNIESIG